jgi:hypothetical protein
MHCQPKIDSNPGSRSAIAPATNADPEAATESKGCKEIAIIKGLNLAPPCPEQSAIGFRYMSW